jgi:hypothetical protein
MARSQRKQPDQHVSIDKRADILLVLGPIRLDETVMSTRDDWNVKIIQRRPIGEFSNWKDKPSHQKAFARLLKDSKAKEDECAENE